MEAEMERSEYRSLLGRLPIRSPSPEDMATLCPHLTANEAVKAFTSGNGYVAVPPTRVRYGFIVLSYTKEWVEKVKVWHEISGKQTQIVTGIKNHPAKLHWAFTLRTRRSYADRKSHGDVFTKSQYMERAMAFAESDWGNELVIDNWDCVGQFYVQDPTDLVVDAYHRGDPRTKAVLGVAFNRDFNSIINDHSKPESELFDDAVSHMTLDSIEFSELRGGRGGYTEFNCAYCTSGLGLNRCTGCGHTFHDNQIRSGWNTPLSHKMVEFLRQSGHNFGVDPQIAWKKERDYWTAHQALNITKHRFGI